MFYVIKLETKGIAVKCRIFLLFFRVSSLEQLSLAEFSGEYARSKGYENDHENVLGIWLDLVSNVKYSTILIFKVIFLCQKLAESF